MNDNGQSSSEPHPLFTLCASPLVLSVFIWVYQVYEWLKNGVWIYVPTSQFLEWGQLQYPTTSWVGVQSLIDEFFSFPLSVTALFATAPLTVISLFFLYVWYGIKDRLMTLRSYITKEARWIIGQIAKCIALQPTRLDRAIAARQSWHLILIMSLSFRL